MLKLPRFIGYVTELSQLFQNMINRAIKFPKADLQPEIKISLENWQKEFIFTIESEPWKGSNVFFQFQKIMMYENKA